MEPKYLARIEAWALGAVERVRSKLKIEDSRIELKREWPQPEKAARRLAGHANASQGSEILWIIGLDEVDGVIGADASELSDWWSGMKSQFDGITPSMTEVSIHTDGQIIWALAFDTSRAPYVVRNPLFGKGPGAVSHEVPWREGSAVRSSLRNDLIRLLTPLAVQPEIEILDWTGYIRDLGEPKPFTGNEGGFDVIFYLSLYITSRSTKPTQVPFHRCKFQLLNPQTGDQLNEFEITFRLPWIYGGPSTSSRIDSFTLERTDNELIIHGPGKCAAEARLNLPVLPEWLSGCNPRVSFSIHVIDAANPLILEGVGQPRLGKKGVSDGWLVTPI